MRSDLLAWGLPIFRVAGISVRIHWSLLLFWLVEIYPSLKIAERTNFKVWIALWGLYTAISFLCILLHEFGHAFTARAVGGAANQILLWPLGGLAMCEVPDHWRPQLIVAAAGPLVTCILFGGALAASFLVPGFSSEATNPYVAVAWYALIEFQLYLLIFNLLPLFPLDGGRIFHSALWGGLLVYGRGYDAHARATTATVWLARVVSVCGIVACVVFGRIFLALLFVWAWLNAEQFRRAGREQAAPDGFLGYDFSMGYTSLERSFGRSEERPARGGSWLRSLFRRTEAADAGDRDEDAPAPPRVEHTDTERRRVDAILEKISAKGLDSLTREERSFLDSVSKRWADRR